MLTNGLQRWVLWVAERPGLSLAAIGLLTVLLGWVAVSQFRMNSDLSELIDQHAPWRVDFDRFEAAFPDQVHTAIVVLSGPRQARVEQVARQFKADLMAAPGLFKAVSAPGLHPFFRDHGFLYLTPGQLDDVADRLAAAQPLLAGVHRQPDLGGVFAVLRQGVANGETTAVAAIMQLLGESAAGFNRGESARQVDWRGQLLGQASRAVQLIYLKPNSSYDAPLPDGVMMAQLRQLVAQHRSEDVEIALTGEIALQHEEIESAISGVTLAGWLALLLLLLVMSVGVRSMRIIAATFSMLGLGMIWTCALAMLTVGEFNTLSIVFLVMFFGLGVDFALHFSLRLQESATSPGPADLRDNLSRATRSVGRAISLCSLTTAIAFLCFVPTAYAGLGDLGIISAAGMLIAWLLTFTYLPAFYGFFGGPSAHRMDLPTSEKVVNALLARRRAVVLTSVAVAMLAGVVTTQARFDYSVLALKDPHSESMRTLRDLQRQGLSNDYQLVVVDAQPVDAQALLALPVVSQVRTPEDWLPAEQDDKLAVLADLQFMFWDMLNTAAGDSAATDVTAIRSSLAALLQSLADASPAPALPGVADFRRQMASLAKASDADLLAWQALVMEGLLAEVAWLRRALQVQPVTFAQLPLEVRQRLQSSQNLWLSVIVPAEDISRVEALSDFIHQVKTVYPQATGRPVIEWGVGNIVIESFQLALMYALAAITIVLLIALRHMGPTVLILMPLVLAGLCTLALGVLLQQPLNMANVLVLPLIFGLGVDNGIHVVDRYLGEGAVDQLMHSSTPRAVLLSTLTTIGAFAALSISPHAGTASIGLLLSMAVGFILVFTVFVLPVLLSFLPARANR